MRINPTYVLHLADNNLILGQRLGEWCGHGPVLEQDIALTNIALDLIGQARLLYQCAAELIGDTSEDALAFLRLEHDYRNVLLVELPNGNFADTVVRQYFYDVFNYLNYDALLQCTDEHLRAIAEKALKEVTYHRRWSGEWVIRLGDGTAESHEKVQDAVNHLWEYTGELFSPADFEKESHKMQNTPDVSSLHKAWKKHVVHTLDTATLRIPRDDIWMQSGGKSGHHSEHMGFILSELQYMQRTYPSMQW
ncbi:MAG TPA: 1,2-phenylacetyl-CoA epoxidase subunit PaaC [Saprospiraceae bacterium]|nr:1,2-phenylacetyl-CoA epoxidase subunit PaaC [Saprospiraceae bacterium]